MADRKKSMHVIRATEPTLYDAGALIRIEHASLADSDYAPDEALSLIRRPEQHAYLADLDGEPVGFCSCFETPLSRASRAKDRRVKDWQADRWRLEIDMLGVLPDFRGQGVATGLIDHSVARGRLRGVRSFRAVVAQDNAASQHAFARAGFSASHPVEMLVHDLSGTVRWPHLPVLPEAWTHKVYTDSSLVHADEVWSAHGTGHEIHALRDGSGQIVALAETLHVFTLAYVGLWIERLTSKNEIATRRMARILMERAKKLACDQVGYLSPPEDRHSGVQIALLQEGYFYVDKYLVLTL